MTHDELKALTGGYVLGALSDAERHEFEAHAATCESCTREVADLRSVADALAYAVPQHNPPPALRERVLRAATGSADASRVIEMKPRPSRAVLPTWLAVAASIAAVALGLYAMTLRQRIESLQQRLREEIARGEAIESQRKVAHAAAERANQVAAILRADDLRRFRLAGQKTAPNASGTAYWSLSRGELLFTAANLPPLAAGRQFQLWVIPKGKNPVSAGMLDVSADGRVNAIALTNAVDDVGAVAVSEEPTGGVVQPTGAIVLLGAQ